MTKRGGILFAVLGFSLASFVASGSPVPGFNRATAPLTSAGSTVGIRAGSTTQTGYITTAQSIAIASLSAATPTATQSPADPLLFYSGKILSVGVPATYLADTFTRANSTNISGTPAQTGGNWTGRDSAAQTMGVLSNKLYRTGAAAGIGTLYSETSHADGLAQMTISVDATAGLLVRWAPGANFNAATGITLWYENTCLRYGTFSGGSATQVTALNCSLSAFPHTIKITYSGTALEFFLDGVSQGTATNATYSSQTQAGVWMSSASGASRVVDFSVASPAIPKGLEYVGYYDNGTDFSTLLMGGDANSGTGGAEYIDTTNAPFSVDASQIKSAVPVGTPPFVITSTTRIPNLNADLLDGHDTSYFQVAGSYVTPACTASLSLAYGTITAGTTTEFTAQTCTGAVVGDECTAALDTTKPVGVQLFAQGDGANTVVVSGACVKGSNCTVSAQNTKIICFHH